MNLQPWIYWNWSPNHDGWLTGSRWIYQGGNCELQGHVAFWHRDVASIPGMDSLPEVLHHCKTTSNRIVQKWPDVGVTEWWWEFMWSWWISNFQVGKFPMSSNFQFHMLYQNFPIFISRGHRIQVNSCAFMGCIGMARVQSVVWVGWSIYPLVN